MARNSDNAQALVDSFVYTGPKGSLLPVDVSTAVDAALKDLGWLTDAGIGETPSTNTTQRRGINGSIIKTIRTDADTSFTFETYERNARIMGLLRPGSTPVTTGGTPEQQTVTITGAPTGGTFTLAVPNFGSITVSATATATALANQLSALTGDTVTVSLAGGVYTVTFPLDMGDVGQMTIAAKALTGGTTPDVTTATTVPAVRGITTTAVKAYLGTDERAWVLHEDFGSFQRRVAVPRGSAFPTGTIQDKPGDLAVIQWRLDCYPISDGTKYFDITNNPAEAA